MKKEFLAEGPVSGRGEFRKRSVWVEVKGTGVCRGLGPVGYSVKKMVPTAVRLPRNCGCREPTLLKKKGGGGCQVIITAHSELSNLFVLGFYVR